MEIGAAIEQHGGFQKRKQNYHVTRNSIPGYIPEKKNTLI